MRQTLSDYDDRDEGYTLLSEARPPESDPPAPPDRRLPKLILSAGAMAVFAGGLWFAYVQGTHHVATGTMVAQGDGGMPILRADPQPTKVKPDQPGGMNVPDQNVSLYNDKPGTAPVEKLLPGPEKVMPRPAPPPPPPAPPAAAQSAPAGTALAPVATQAAPAKPNDKTAAVKPKPAPIEKQAALEKPAAETKPPVVKQPAAAPPKTEATPAAKSNGPIQLRLASMRTPEAAKEEWARLKSENSDLLGNVRAVAVRTDLGDKGIYYRIEAGPFADAAAAERICGEMKRRNLGCILAR